MGEISAFKTSTLHCLACDLMYSFLTNYSPVPLPSMTFYFSDFIPIILKFLFFRHFSTPLNTPTLN